MKLKFPCRRRNHCHDDYRQQQIHKYGKHTIRRTLQRIMLLLAALIIVLYTANVFRFYNTGLDDGLHASFRMEARKFVELYEANPNIFPPSTPTRPGYLSWQQVPEELRQKFPKVEHSPFQVLEHKQVESEHNWRNGILTFMYSHPIAEGQTLYLFSIFEMSRFSDEEIEAFDNKLNFTLPLGLTFLIIAFLAASFTGRRIAQSTDDLADWADSLTLDEIDNERPELRYSELNRVADRLHESFHRIGTLLAKEHFFLRNASHELRTPISIARANLELLSKMGVDERQKAPLERLFRANHTMQNLTETLLWLSRDQNKTPLSVSVSLTEQVEQQHKDLNYLLQGKEVQVNFQLPEQANTLNLPITALQIVLHNLLRNAYQHTEEGQVDIIQHANQIRISNKNNHPNNSEHPDSIGLGLQLISQICERLEWQLELKPSNNGIDALLTLPDEESC